MPLVSGSQIAHRILRNEDEDARQFVHDLHRGETVVAPVNDRQIPTLAPISDVFSASVLTSGANRPISTVAHHVSEEWIRGKEEGMYMTQRRIQTESRTL